MPLRPGRRCSSKITLKPTPPFNSSNAISAVATSETRCMSADITLIHDSKRSLLPPTTKILLMSITFSYLLNINNHYFIKWLFIPISNNTYKVKVQSDTLHARVRCQKIPIFDIYIPFFTNSSNSFKGSGRLNR